LFDGVFDVQNGVTLFFILTHNILPNFFLGFVDMFQRRLVVNLALFDYDHFYVEDHL
jgi:hypothetical protein